MSIHGAAQTRSSSVHHPITINVIGTNVKINVPPKGTLNVGDTVEYHADRGEATVTFVGDTPLENHEMSIGDSMTARLVKAGTFNCQCDVLLPDGSHAGWTANGPGDVLNGLNGGVHDVGTGPTP